MIPLRFARLIWPFLFWCLGVTAATAGDATISVTAGQDVVLARYYEVRQAECLALQVPRVNITTAPQLGRATVVRVQHETVAVGGRCGTMAVPVVQVHYRARQPGTDSLAWEVRYQARGAAPAQATAQVRVLPPARPAPP